MAADPNSKMLETKSAVVRRIVAPVFRKYRICRIGCESNGRLPGFPTHQQICDCQFENVLSSVFDYPIPTVYHLFLGISECFIGFRQQVLQNPKAFTLPHHPDRLHNISSHQMPGHSQTFAPVLPTFGKMRLSIP